MISRYRLPEKRCLVFSELMLVDYGSKDKAERFALALKGPTLVTDGACNLCDAAGSFITARLRPSGELFYLWAQHADTIELLGPLGVSKEDLMTSWALIHNNEIYRGSDAWFLTQPWRFLFSACGLVPRVLREAVYGCVARHRYRLFGGTDACQRPDKSRARFFLHSTV
jgi:predicted DCC family thiol-disulfide oxidoreductase YuxK